MDFCVTVLPEKVKITVPADTNLLDALRNADLAPDAPCGGRGTCGKCRVMVDGEEMLACQTVVDRDMTVQLPMEAKAAILTDGLAVQSGGTGYSLAFDIGTTTVVGFLLDGGKGVGALFGIGGGGHLIHDCTPGAEPTCRCGCLRELGSGNQNHFFHRMLLKTASTAREYPAGSAHRPSRPG